MISGQAAQLICPGKKKKKVTRIYKNINYLAI